MQSREDKKKEIKLLSHQRKSQLWKQRKVTIFFPILKPSVVNFCAEWFYKYNLAKRKDMQKHPGG